MPFINTITTKAIDKTAKEELTRAYGRAIELISGKSEQWLMLKFEGNAEMAFRGDAVSDCAMVEVELYGGASAADADAFTNAASKLLFDTLGIPEDRIYIKYFGTDKWGYDGSNF